MNDLKDKNVIITGASQGIGEKIAEQFSNYKSNIFLISRNIKKLNNLKSKLLVNDKIVNCYSGDVTDANQINDIIKDIYNNYNKIDVLINNAGITNDNILATMKYNQWHEVINTNLYGTFNCSKSVVRYMLKQKSGKIINISSIIAQIGNKGQTNYSASKAGIIGFTKSLAKELATRNINVNAINPGFIKTEMTETIINDKEFLNTIPLKKYGSAEDVANLACFLSSEKSNYITGQAINVDGGLAM